ncbi:MAG: hypothetical protein Terrestrivirus5_19 [Terrestrivirus sp.]|uniref:Uncharacterized protein n=1 Tax=Terrestrivirus sp. TaxID=2487775 RepID=A0A3G4ZMX5_9VIRU|nr:MAG: hypothetical protein Terrestrivirus5_19 [Terrestrivirus sp.]
MTEPKFYILQSGSGAGKSKNYPSGITETYIVPEDEFLELFELVTVETKSRSGNTTFTHQQARVKKASFSIDSDLFQRRFTLSGVYSVVPEGTPYKVLGTYFLAEDWDANV